MKKKCVAIDLSSNEQKRTKRIYQKRRRHGHYKLSSQYFLTGHNCLTSSRRVKINREFKISQRGRRRERPETIQFNYIV